MNSLEFTMSHLTDHRLSLMFSLLLLLSRCLIERGKSIFSAEGPHVALDFPSDSDLNWLIVLLSFHEVLGSTVIVCLVNTSQSFGNLIFAHILFQLFDRLVHYLIDVQAYLWITHQVLYITQR